MLPRQRTKLHSTKARNVHSGNATERTEDTEPGNGILPCHVRDAGWALRNPLSVVGFGTSAWGPWNFEDVGSKRLPFFVSYAF